ncbi:MAG TPA: Stp1/IreP family PP2C-type Ser/Thr phosphatase [Bacillota bacterium]|jgi:protein phosphatase
MVQTGERTDTGLVRKVNEDSYCVDRRGPFGRCLLAVADGLGGQAAGEVASRVALEVMRQVLARSNDSHPAGDSTPNTAREALVRAAQEANDRVYQMAAHLPEYQGMGTTLTTVLVPAEGGRQAVFSHVGDSRAYLVRNGVARQLTDDHSFVGELVRNGDLTEDEAMRHPHRNILTKALGTEDSVPVDSGLVDVEDGDCLVVCSDGLSNLVSADEVASAVGGKADLQEAVDGLVELAKARRGHDNITVVAARLAPEEAGA